MSRRKESPGIRVAIALVAAAIVALLVSPVPGVLPRTVRTAEVGPSFRDKVDHIVIVMMENHAYDNYFARYCPTVGPYCPSVATGEPPGLCVPNFPSNPALGCTAPFPFGPKNLSLARDLPHFYNQSRIAWNQGAMNGFYNAESQGRVPFGYYDGQTAPIYWDLAEQYALGDHFFSSTLSYSLPNHWHLVAGQTPESVERGLIQTSDPNWLANRTQYLQEANHTRSAEDLLMGSPVSWKWYDFPLAPTYGEALGSLTPGVGGAGSAFAYWNPQAGKAESYNATFSPHFVNNTDFFGDARAGTLPNVSWVIPHANASDHPPANVTEAEAFVANVVDAVAASPEWNRTALFVSWDDYGGFYDHVAPPTFAGITLGFRVPFLVIGPYVRENFVSHQLGFFESLLRLIEYRWRLPCLTALDCGAPLPLDVFDFSRPPRAPLLFPTNASYAQYPMVLQALNATYVPIVPFYPNREFVVFPHGPGVSED